MVQVNSSFEQVLINDFGDLGKVKNILQKGELYRFSNYSISQQAQLFSQQKVDVLNDSHVKKHYNKLLEMIFLEFGDLRSKVHFNKFFTPIISSGNWEKRRDLIADILNVDNISKKDFKTLFDSLKDLVIKPRFSKRIIVFSETYSSVLYDEFKIVAEVMSEKEFIQISEDEEYLQDLIVVCDDIVNAEVQQYKFKDFLKVVCGKIIWENKNSINSLISIYNLFGNSLNKITLFGKETIGREFKFDIDLVEFKNKLESGFVFDSSAMIKKVESLNLVIDELNLELKKIITEKKVSLEGDALLELLQSGNVAALQKIVEQDTKDKISKKERELIDELKLMKLNIHSLFENQSYPVKIEEGVQDVLFKQIDELNSSNEFDFYNDLGKFDLTQIFDLFSLSFVGDLIFSLKRFVDKFDLKYPQVSNEFVLNSGRNMYIENPSPINYAIGSSEFELNKERVSILTGANSGGKTTLLEMLLQAQILTTLGLPISAEEGSKVNLLQEVIYLKKFTGTAGSGAFEQTIRQLLNLLNSSSSKLILIDEFEAVTEPGAAAKILLTFLEELTKRDVLCVGVSHLGLEIQEFIRENNINGIRLDGISATGLGEDGKLITNHQPQFYQLGKSTPELILKRVLQDEKFWNNKEDKLKNLLERMF